jgi:hypothetical protein
MPPSLTRSLRPSLLAAVCLAASPALPTGHGAQGTGHPSSETARHASPSPSILNIYNFIRNSDHRLDNSEDVLFGATWHQIDLLERANLPATWALQYDALINPRYQSLLKAHLATPAGSHDEIAAWWELPRALVEKAGLHWRGAHDWDSQANIGFSPGYAPDERRRLVDVYMADFRSIFGYYPRSVGSWYIDEVTLAYMADKYGIVASCNCKDQVGTDGYTLWGGYWSHAYYPSRLNAYMPAQTAAGQINVPIFRMLGSDPIYQYGAADRITTMEPVYPSAGGSATWVEWFMRTLIHQPSLAFAYAQVGQENSFGWDAMRVGYTLQVDLLAKQSRAGEIQLQTLAESGLWFRKRFPLTPATSVVALEDWQHTAPNGDTRNGETRSGETRSGDARKTVWYDSRFYRANVLWEGDTLTLRDLHRFDESVVSTTHDAPLLAKSLTCATLPIMDASQWTGPRPPGMWPVTLSTDGTPSPMKVAGPPTVTESSLTDLSISQPLVNGGTLSLTLSESSISCSATDPQRHPIPWAWTLIGNAPQTSTVESIEPNAILYRQGPTNYRLRLTQGTAQRSPDGVIQITATPDGKITLNLGPG